MCVQNTQWIINTNANTQCVLHIDSCEANICVLFVCCPNKCVNAIGQNVTAIIPSQHICSDAHCDPAQHFSRSMNLYRECRAKMS